MGDAQAWLLTIVQNVNGSKIRPISANARTVNIYPLPEDSSLAVACFCLGIRDVASESQAVAEGMQPAAMSTGDYHGIAAR